MNLQPHLQPFSRRRLLAAAASAAAWAAVPAPLRAAEKHAAAGRRYLMGKAEHCIMLWLGGGAAQIDTFDPKALGDPGKRVTGSAYPSIGTAIRGEQVCEHLELSAPLLDRAAILRTVHHDVIDEHAAATNRMHTGRPTSETIQYPALGAILAQQRGAAGENVPAYVLMGYPNLARDPGFLGPRHGYIYLTETASGPNGLTPPPGLAPQRLDRRRRLLESLAGNEPAADEVLGQYAQAAEEAYKLSGPQFMGAFGLDQEPASLRERYGGEFGQRCLLARRLVQRGVRFIEIAQNMNFLNGTGWDTHREGQINQHVLIRELDQAFSALLLDLEKHKLLEKTLIVINTEFGRPPEFDGGGGRGHQASAFSVVLAGGGLKGGQVIGQTDEMSRKIMERPVSVPDFFATICCAMGVDPSHELKAPGDRPVPITDMGQPVRELFA